MNIEDIRSTNEDELEQVEKYGYVVVGDSAERARKIKWLLNRVDELEYAVLHVDECPKCALNRSRLEQSERMSDKRHAICHRYEQDIKKAHAVLSAALEGES